MLQVNQTNWYLVQQAEHFNNMTMQIYGQQMRAELLNLHTMLTYFNAGRGNSFCKFIENPMFG